MTTNQSYFDFRLHLPQEIDWLPHKEAARFMGISESQYRKDSLLLEKIGVLKREKKGCNRENLGILLAFREYVRERGRESAAFKIVNKIGD